MFDYVIELFDRITHNIASWTDNYELSPSYNAGNGKDHWSVGSMANPAQTNNPVQITTTTRRVAKISKPFIHPFH